MSQPINPHSQSETSLHHQAASCFITIRIPFAGRSCKCREKSERHRLLNTAVLTRRVREFIPTLEGSYQDFIEVHRTSPRLYLIGIARLTLR